MAAQSGWAAFFDGHAPAYNDNVFTKNTVAEVDFLIDALEVVPGASILDVGCGTGRHSVELARRGFAVTGVDLSKGMLAQARKAADAAGVTVTLHQADASRFRPEETFDGVICLCEGAFGLLGSRDDPIGQPLAILRNVAAAMRPETRCLFTVLNAMKMIRTYGPQDIADGQFDPLALAERSEVAPPGDHDVPPMRERGFVPTEMVLLFALAGLDVLNIWGGTAGNWGRRAIDPDEFEIMLLGRKPADSERPRWT
jgi:SAM-dependent methyltransferase